jgi:hypothetical protein
LPNHFFYNIFFRNVVKLFCDDAISMAGFQQFSLIC